jgi:hypothetical protein
LVKERSKKIKWTNHYEGQASSTRKKLYHICPPNSEHHQHNGDFHPS